MLRASADISGIQLNYAAIGDKTQNSGRADAEALLRFTEALVARTSDLDAARDQLAEELGEDAVAAAAGSAGNFEMMNRIVDAVGVRVPPSMRASAVELGLSDLF